jgi:hypothetical protein
MSSASQAALQIPELVDAVLEELPASDCLSASSVNSLFHAASIKPIYRTFRHHGSSSERRVLQLLDVLERKEYGRHFQSLSIVFGVPCSPNAALLPLVARLLVLVTRLTTLHLKLIPVTTDSSALFNALSTSEHLEHLICMFDGPCVRSFKPRS